LSFSATSYVSASAGRTTVGELGTEWLENKRQALKPSSFYSLDVAWRVHVAPRWAKTPVGDKSLEPIDATARIQGLSCDSTKEGGARKIPGS
jgi:hypothetical protein